MVVYVILKSDNKTYSAQWRKAPYNQYLVNDTEEDNNSLTRGIEQISACYGERLHNK